METQNPRQRSKCHVWIGVSILGWMKGKIGIPLSMNGVDRHKRVELSRNWSRIVQETMGQRKEKSRHLDIKVLDSINDSFEVFCFSFLLATWVLPCYLKVHRDSHRNDRTVPRSQIMAREKTVKSTVQIMFYMKRLFL